MLNVDAPMCKDLATASRFAHTVGVCHLGEYLARLRGLSQAEQDAIVAAAVLHDMGIPPFGHLLEQMFDELDPPFDHESIARQIVEGTYAPENRYHQIYGGLTLKVGAVLDKFNVDRDSVFRLLEARRSPTVIAGPIDLDNIDNVLRMATLLGLGSFRNLAYRLAAGLEVMPGGRVRLASRATGPVSEWLRLRARCYEMMMYPREGIAYAALAHDLAEVAVRKQIVTKKEWFLTDDRLMRRLLENEGTAPLARQLETGIQYEAVSAVRLVFDAGTGPTLRGERRRKFANAVEGRAGITGGEDLAAFVWYEYAKISRSIDVTVERGSELIGNPSSTALVALIHTRRRRGRGTELIADVGRTWPGIVIDTAREFGDVVSVEDLPDARYFTSPARSSDNAQLSFFGES